MQANLIYLIVVNINDDIYIDCLSWCVYSLRKLGHFEDDIIVITDKSYPKTETENWRPCGNKTSRSRFAYRTFTWEEWI